MQEPRNDAFCFFQHFEATKDTGVRPLNVYITENRKPTLSKSFLSAADRNVFGGEAIVVARFDSRRPRTQQHRGGERSWLHTRVVSNRSLRPLRVSYWLQCSENTANRRREASSSAQIQTLPGGRLPLRTAEN